MRISPAPPCYDAQARFACGYPLGARRVQAVEALPQRYPQKPSPGSQLPIERIVEGEVLRSRAADAGEHLRAQRSVRLHVHAPAARPDGVGEPLHPAIAAYRQHSRDFDPAPLGRHLDHII